MTVATYTTNMTDLMVGAGDKANATALGGGSSGLNDETDYFIQGTGMISKNAFASAKKGIIYDCISDRASLIGTDGAFAMWTTHATPNSLDLQANGGIDMVVGSGTGNYKHYYVGGSDSIEFMGWIFAAVNPSETADEADTGTPTAVEDHVGVMFDLPSGGPTKGAPNALDAIRAGRCDIIYEFGTSTDPDASFELAVTNRGDVTDRWGLIQLVNGSYFLSGLHQLGSATNAVDFTDSNKTLFWRDHPGVTKPFNTIDIQNASSTFSLTNIVWSALGTKTPGTWTTTDDAVGSITSCNFISWGTFTHDSNTTITGVTYLTCEKVTIGGATITSTNFDSLTAATHVLAATPAEAALISGSTFTSSGTGNGLEITGTVADITLTDLDFTGYSTTVDADKAIYVNIASGTINISISGGSGIAVSSDVRTAGATVNIISGAVDVTANATLKDGTAVASALVYLKASDGTGPFPFEDTVTITRATTTATVAHTAHGMATNDKIVLQGITDKTEDNYVIKQITVTTANAYTYTTTDSGSASYTGTILSTFVALSGLTGAGGDLTLSRVYSSNQPVTGWTRKASATPFLQEGVLNGIIDSSTGFNGTAVMLSDE